MNNKKYISAVMALTTLATLATAIPAFADNTTTPVNQSASVQVNYRGKGMNRSNRAMMKPGMFGTVSAISGNIITITGKQGFGTNAIATTFTVDATNAKVTKNNAAGTVSSILIGDTIMAQGTVSGTNIAATMIRDGVMRGGPGTQENKMTGSIKKINQENSPIAGNGQPVIAGNVSAISGNILTITNKSNITYTVDATNAKIAQGPNIILISNIVVGDAVIIQGTVNGNSVVASSVVDQTRPISTTTTSGTTAQPRKGFFGGVGSFFAHMFGF